MRILMTGLAAAILVCAMAFGEAPWRQLYTGDEAAGEDVIALWQFLPGAEAEDGSGNGHRLTLHGDSRFAEDGLFGSCLESFPSDEEGRAQHGATARNRPSLTPVGAFTLEAWIRPKPELADRVRAFLIDKKSVYYTLDRPNVNNDYQLTLLRGGRQMQAVLGYGEDSEVYNSETVELPAGEWSHVAFTYNGAGLGRFFLNGEQVGLTYHEGRGPVAHGRRALAIGERSGSRYFGFPGFLEQVRILNGTPAWLAPKPSASLSPMRTVYQRMEEGAHLNFFVHNSLESPLRGLRATVHLEGRPLGAETRLSDIPALQADQVSIPVDTDLKPGEYPLAVRFAGVSDDGEVEFHADTTLTIAPRPLPDVFPVVMWGRATIEELLEMGFTHSEYGLSSAAPVWRAGEVTVPLFTGDAYHNRVAQMDAFLAAGLHVYSRVRPGSWPMRNEALRAQYGRVNREGELWPRPNVCGLFPEIQEFAFNVGASSSQTFGHHPAWDAGLVDPEVRDGTNLCFHEHDRAAYREHSGRDIPDEAISRQGIHAGRRDEFVPRDGIIEDDDRILDFFRWFWRVGDGWNELFSQAHRGFKTGTPDNWTFWAPAVRCPPIWGSGGEVDILSQWTYTYPETPRIALATDELFAMADGRPGQQVMKMTQIIWYRNRTAPHLPEREEDRAPWEKEGGEPEARFITIAPDHLRGAFWHKIARPVRGVLYHGIGSLVFRESGGYRYTNPETRVALAELTRDVAVPLGPSLLNIPDPPADVAILESFTSFVFGAQATWGWGHGWVADMHQLLQWARLQPRVIYEDHVLRDNLDGFKVLVMPNCPVLPRSVYERVAEFQRRGGVVVGDQHLAQAIMPDILVREPERRREPHLNKAALQELAGKLREELAPVYSWRTDSSDPDIIVRRRQHGEAEYVFAINDKRTYGDYVGHHRLVMEQGVPHRGTLKLARPGAAVYDLLASQAVPTRNRADGVEWDVAFGPGEGRVYLALPRPVAAVQAAVAQRQPTARRVEVSVSVVDGAGRPLPAVVPVRVDILDPNGEQAEFSGHYAAKDGQVAQTLDLAPNDAAGEWTVRAKELASGKTTEAKFIYVR